MMIYVPVDLIEPNPYQKRTEYGDIEGLAADIARQLESRPETRGLLQVPSGRLMYRGENGVINLNQAETARQLFLIGVGKPLLPERHAGVFVQLEIGHRRHRAFKHNWEMAVTGFEDGLMPINIVVSSDEQMIDAVFSENAKRKDITAVESAELIAAKLAMPLPDGSTRNQSDLAREWGIDPSTVSNSLRLLDLPPELQQANRDGRLSARAATALLMVYSLPEPTLKAAKELKGFYSSDNLEILTKKAMEGMSSNDIRDKASSIIERCVQDLTHVHFDTSHVFEGEGYRSPVCRDCPVSWWRGAFKVCGDCRGDDSCLKRKERTYLSLVMTKAQEAYPNLPLIDTRSWNVERFYSRAEMAKGILDAGCPKGRLSLQYHKDGGNVGLPVEGVPQAVIVCNHGERGRCVCLAEAEKRSDAKQKHEEIDRRYREQVRRPAIQAVASRLVAGDQNTLRYIFNRMAKEYVRIPDKPMSFEELCHYLAGELVSPMWNDPKDIEGCRKNMNEHLAAAGIVINWDVDETAVAEDVERKLGRIEGWIKGLLTKQPTHEALNGNLENLAKLQDELTTPALLDRFARRILDTVAVLNQLKMCVPHLWPGDIELVAVLVNMPCDFKIFKDTLSSSRPAVIEYALAFADNDDEERAEVLVMNLPKWEGNDDEKDFVFAQNGEVKAGKLSRSR